MATDDDLTEFLRVTDVVRIVTTTRDGRTIATPIWAVDVDGASFIRSEYGHDAKWFRRATTNPGVGFETPSGTRAVELEAIDESRPARGRRRRGAAGEVRAPTGVARRDAHARSPTARRSAWCRSGARSDRAASAPSRAASGPSSDGTFGLLTRDTVREHPEYQIRIRCVR